MVAYRVTGTVDALAEGVGGHLVGARDVDSLIARLSALLHDADRRVEMGQAGRSWVVGRFDQSTLWQALGDTYVGWLINAGAPLPSKARRFTKS